MSFQRLFKIMGDTAKKVCLQNQKEKVQTPTTLVEKYQETLVEKYQEMEAYIKFMEKPWVKNLSDEAKGVAFASFQAGYISHQKERNK